jgi:hypothetical protein
MTPGEGTQVMIQMMKLDQKFENPFFGLISPEKMIYRIFNPI